MRKYRWKNKNCENIVGKTETKMATCHRKWNLAHIMHFSNICIKLLNNRLVIKINFVLKVVAMSFVVPKFVNAKKNNVITAKQQWDYKVTKKRQLIMKNTEIRLYWSPPATPKYRYYRQKRIAIYAKITLHFASRPIWNCSNTLKAWINAKLSRKA